MNDIVHGAVPKLATVRALNMAVVAADAAIVTARAAVADADKRRQPLRDRLAAMDCDGCQHDALDPALADALVADPTAVPDVEAMAAAVSASRKAQDVHNMQKAVIQEAIDKIGLEVAAAQARLNAAQVAREAAWKDFVVAAHLHLGERLRHEFEALRVDVIEPMLALQDEAGTDGRNIASHTAPRLNGDFEITVRLFEKYQPLAPEVNNIPMPVGFDQDAPAFKAPEPETPAMKTRWRDERLFPIRREPRTPFVDPIDHLRGQLASK